ncbi:hypothetical protein [Kutzneria sp. CA-103260]|uniref:hypothetical protein n=1 Tax=Kutzneria sp. CA-103260 TaxID=2802641 RepID=UPI001BA8DA56|nr:hypothetical protein [Kutzneria sp. CA-103260]QUQ63293.1 hypothetical protein JJ691_10050 [Kutzneria sp. CA-103260]
MDDASVRMRVVFDERIGDSRAELAELLGRCGVAGGRSGYLAEIAARLEVFGSAGEPSSTPILDAGADGLEYFRRHGPERARRQRREFDFDAEIGRRYASQRGIPLAELRADAEQLESLCSDMLDVRHEPWQRAMWQRVGGFADTLRVACDAVERIVFDKADAVHRLADDPGPYDDDRYEARLAVFEAACRHAEADIADVLRRLGGEMAATDLAETRYVG